MDLSVLTNKGEDTGRKVKLEKLIFEIEPNDHAIYLDVKSHLANRRQGTHKTKGRAEIVGSTRKIKKQKGTGTARAGSIKNPLFRGGGRVFGPEPRNHSFKLNKKLRQLARKSALTYKAKDKNISIIEDFNFEKPRTKNYLDFLNGMSLIDKKTLLVIPETDKNLVLSGRNIKKSKVIKAEQINTYDVLNADNLLLFESSVNKVNDLFK